MAPKSLPVGALHSEKPGASSSGMRRIVTFVITEEVEREWTYHWSSMADQMKGLCGRETMPANIDPGLWGGSHPVIQVHWCESCQDMKQRILPDAP